MLYDFVYMKYSTQIHREKRWFLNTGHRGRVQTGAKAEGEAYSGELPSSATGLSSGLKKMWAEAAEVASHSPVNVRSPFLNG